MTTYSYYVEPGYWADGYADDITVNFVYSSSRIAATGTIVVAGSYVKDTGAAVEADASVAVAGGYVRLDGALVSALSSVIPAATTIKPISGTSLAFSIVISDAAVSQTFPGVNLNAKSSALAAISITTKTSAVVQETSSTKAGSRIFWEMTQPASGTWQTVQPQAEGFGP